MGTTEEEQGEKKNDSEKSGSRSERRRRRKREIAVREEKEGWKFLRGLGWMEKREREREGWKLKIAYESTLLQKQNVGLM